MKVFQNPELKRVLFSARDILTTSAETDDTEPTTPKTTDNDGSIITPPDEFDD